MKGSHNPNRPSYKGSTAEEYKAFYDRIERALNVEDMTPNNLSEWLQSDSHPLIDQLSLVSLINKQIKDAQTIEEIKELKEEISSLPLHKQELNKRASSRIEELAVEKRERIITAGITSTKDFAEERKINLSEKVLGRVEKWKDGTTRIVIREKGKLKAWRIVK